MIMLGKLYYCFFHYETYRYSNKIIFTISDNFAHIRKFFILAKLNSNLESLEQLPL